MNGPSPRWEPLSATLLEYRHSCRLVRGRIRQLDAEIDHPKGTDQLQELLDRRSLLYRELWDMLLLIRSLEEYLEPSDSAQPPQAKLCGGCN